MKAEQALATPVPFGDNYQLIEQLAVGGMAEIYRARRNAMAGFEKEVVIKRLKPNIAAQPQMVEMFLDEARISAVLNHPNIVHVYDVSEHEGVPYIAMELIRGEELNVLCRRGLELGQFLPLAHAVDLIRQAAAGMGYFHAQRDEQGEGYDIVHCDISPTNLLVTEDGGLKIIDFGIARARHQLYRDHGALPGKISYMSPEQVARGPLDHRSDIFALGVVLYEITVGRRLFKGPAADVVRRVRDCKIEPPTFVRREYPGHLESIVMRALERHPEDRYESAYDLADELEDFLREAKLKSGALRIARYLDGLEEASGGQRRPELVAEAERRAGDDDEDLDFDRGVFDSFQEMLGGSEADAHAWDEFEEDEGQVADALGVEPSQLDKIGAKLASTRRPRPGEPSVEAAVGDVEPEPSAEEGVNETSAAGNSEDDSASRSRPGGTATGRGGPKFAASTSSSADNAEQHQSAGALNWVFVVWAVVATLAAAVALLR